MQLHVLYSSDKQGLHRIIFQEVSSSAKIIMINQLLKRLRALSLFTIYYEIHMHLNIRDDFNN